MTRSDQWLVAAWRAEMRITVPFFDGADVELLFEDEAEIQIFADTIRSFLKLGAEHRAAATRHAIAYLTDFTEAVGIDWDEIGMAAVRDYPELVWRFVKPNTLAAMESWDIGTRDKTRKYVLVECNCAWEEEHGILFSWRDGTELVKVSGYDGHATNAHAYDDLSKDAYVYDATDEDYSTRLGPVILLT